MSVGDASSRLVSARPSAACVTSIRTSGSPSPVSSSCRQHLWNSNCRGGERPQTLAHDTRRGTLTSKPWACDVSTPVGRGDQEIPSPYTGSGQGRRVARHHHEVIALVVEVGEL